MTRTSRKLIEVALPLEAINVASAREKSIRHGHPSTLHLWWARRPLAAARAVIFAQMVDDPSSYPDLFPTEKAQERERQRLFKIIEELVQWENTTNEEVLQKAREEIWQSWRRACAENADHPRAAELFDRHKLPGFHDPFAGGGALPLEAQRLGLEAYASDLNPVAVLINKAMIEIPPKFAGCPAVNPEWQSTPAREKELRVWRGAQGLAEDVRYYGKWMRDEAESRIGHLYPKVEITPEMAKGRPDLKPLVGQTLTVIAWLWARTVKSPNPAFASVDVPLASTFMLSKKPGRDTYVEPLIEGGGYRFTVTVGRPKNPVAAKNGTKLGRGANFRCLMSGSPIEADYIRSEAQAGRMGARLMAVVAEGARRRAYLAPTFAHETMARQAQPSWKPDLKVPTPCHDVDRLPMYGMPTWGDVFTPRQLVALTTFADLVREAHGRVKCDAPTAGLVDTPSPGAARGGDVDRSRSSASRPFTGPTPPAVGEPPAGRPSGVARGLDAGGTGAAAYADAIATYLAFAVDKEAESLSTICTWSAAPKNELVVSTFRRQALPMTWDFGEANPFADSSGSLAKNVAAIARSIEGALPAAPRGYARQADAGGSSAPAEGGRAMPVVSTDPPYYDNISYADLSDFFYVWLRRALKLEFPDLFATLAVPKEAELVATPYRHGSKAKAEAFFLDGMTQAMHRLAEQAHPAFPVTVYYAFKQAESESDEGTSSTGWETFLDAVIRAGFALSGTWPMRTERGARSIGIGSNALASSIVLVCRPRAADAPSATRREFVAALKAELPSALGHLQRSNIAPVDLAQAAIGPGMAVYTRYAQVVDAAGKAMSVREALGLINQTLDEVLTKQEGDFDGDSRFALAWFEQFGFSDGDYGVAEVLATAKVTSVGGLAEAGVVASRGGKVRLLKPKELPTAWDPASDTRLTAWEMVHHLVRVLEQGESAAAELLKAMGGKADVARELAYRLYALCERKKRAPEALAYNGLVQSWPEITRLAREGGTPRRAQAGLFDATEE